MNKNMSKHLYKTKEEYDKALEELDKATGLKLPNPEYPSEFPALLCVNVKFHRIHESTQMWVYKSDFLKDND